MRPPLKMMTRSIGGREFELTHLPATTSLRLWGRLIKQHAEAIAQAMSSFGEDDQSQLDAIGAVCKSLDPDLLDELRVVFSQVTSVDHRPISDDAQYNAVFRGRVKDQITWLHFCLTSEYGHFFDSLASEGVGSLVSPDPSTPNT